MFDAWLPAGFGHASLHQLHLLSFYPSLLHLVTLYASNEGCPSGGCACPERNYECGSDILCFNPVTFYASRHSECELNHNFADWQGYGLNEIEASTDCAVYSFDDLAWDLLSREFQIQWCVIKLRSTHCRTAWRMKFRSTVPASMSFMSAIQYGQHHLLANCASGARLWFIAPHKTTRPTIQIEETTDSRTARLCFRSGKDMVYSTGCESAEAVLVGG